MSILIIDDSVDNRMLFKYILENAGYTDVLTAGSAHDAFKVLGMENPSEADSVVDLILMDIKIKVLTIIPA